MTTGAYLIGLVFFLPTLGASLAAAMIVLRRRYDYLTGLARGLAFCVLGTGAIIFVHILPTALGVLTRGTALVAALLTLAAAWLLTGRARIEQRRDPAPRSETESRVSILIAAVSLLVLVSSEVARVQSLISQPVTNIDLLAFHLPGVARFIQTGTLWQVNQFLPGFATAQYPHNSDFLLLAFVLPWHDMAFVRVPALVFLLITGVATYALARELGARRSAAVTFTALALAVPPLVRTALFGLLDDMTLALLVTGCLFLVRHARTGRRGELTLAGLSLGLGLGGDWFGLTATAVIVLVWLGTRVIDARARRALPGNAGWLVGMIAAGGGFWMLRNLIQSGNPLYPKAISVLGVNLFGGSHGDVIDRFGYTIADYLAKPHVLREHIYPGFKHELGVAGLVLLAGLGGALWSARRQRGGHARCLLAGVVTVAGILVVYAITPGTAYGPQNLPVEGVVTIRWLTPAVVIAAAVAAAALPALGRWGVLFELAALAGLLDAIHIGPPVPHGTAVLVGVVLVAVAAAIAAARATIRRRPERSVGRGLAAALCGLAILIVVARVDQRRVDTHGYGRFDPVVAWLDRWAPSGHRVGLTGGTGEKWPLSPGLLAFGPRLGNSVVYVGQRVVHSVELPPSKSTFAAELRRGNYDLLLVGLPYAGDTDRWARALGLRQLARSTLLALYSVPRDV